MHARACRQREGAKRAISSLYYIDTTDRLCLPIATVHLASRRKYICLPAACQPRSPLSASSSCCSLAPGLAAYAFLIAANQTGKLLPERRASTACAAPRSLPRLPSACALVFFPSPQFVRLEWSVISCRHRLSVRNFRPTRPACDFHSSESET